MKAEMGWLRRDRTSISPSPRACANPAQPNRASAIKIARVLSIRSPMPQTPTAPYESNTLFSCSNPLNNQGKLAPSQRGSGPGLKVVPDQQFRDLDAVQRGPLAHIIGHDPQVQAA